MKMKSNKFKIALIILIINFSVSSMEASSGFYNSDISSCEEKVYAWMSAGEQEDEAPMLLEAKNAYKTKEYEKAIQSSHKVKNVHREQAILMQASIKDYLWEPS